jgi:TIR domain
MYYSESETIASKEGASANFRREITEIDTFIHKVGYRFLLDDAASYLHIEATRLKILLSNYEQENLIKAVLVPFCNNDGEELHTLGENLYQCFECGDEYKAGEFIEKLGYEIMKKSTNPIRDKVFISYSHRDKNWFDDLKTHLAEPIRDGEIDAWDDTRIESGQQWEQEIYTALSKAKVGVFLVTKNFLASNFIAKIEVPKLLEAATYEGLYLVWVLISPCRYEKLFGKYQAAFDVSKPLRGLKPVDRDKAWVQIVNDIITKYNS